MQGRIVLGLVVLGAAAGCATVVPGSGHPATPVPPAPTSTTSPGTQNPGTPAPDPATPGPPRSGLAADVLDDECLLDAIEFSALLGRPVLPPEQGDVPRPDGASSSACFVDSAAGSPEPLAAVNVYTPRSGTPAEFVRGGPPQGRRELSGVGEAAVLVDTAPGSTLQLAAPRHVVTITVLDGTPSDGAWRAAAAAALAALPS